MIITNCYVLNNKKQFAKATIYIVDNRIKEVDFSCDKIKKNESEEIIDANGAYAIPGLIDTHIHGAVHHDFCNGDRNGLIKIATYLKKEGITAFCPTSMTLDIDSLKRIFETTKEPLPDYCSEILGIHIEGPFLSEAKKGAQNSSFLQLPSIELFQELSTASNNNIKIITLAPELDGSNKFIQEVSNITNISLGHTNANYEIADTAYRLGANRITHLYNAMPPFTHRNPGVIGAAFDHKEVYVELIADGIHVHPSVIRSTFEMFGEDRIILISDAMMATGMEAGEYELGGQKVYMKDRTALLSDGTIAGSATNLMDCLRSCVNFGIPLEVAVRAATENPAKSIGVFDEMGSVESGKRANIVLMNQNLEIIKVIMNGQ